jgi:two-component system response regulator YesN
LFKKETGEGFVEYVTKFRVEKAKALLKNADLKAVEVGPMVGFSDPKYFSKVFKKTTGMTPSEFKDRNR